MVTSALKPEHPVVRTGISAAHPAPASHQKKPAHLDPLTPFTSINDAADALGLGRRYVRDEADAGRVPGIRSGNRFKVNLPAYRRQLGVDVDLPGGAAV